MASYRICFNNSRIFMGGSRSEQSFIQNSTTENVADFSILILPTKRELIESIYSKLQSISYIMNYCYNKLELLYTTSYCYKLESNVRRNQKFLMFLCHNLSTCCDWKWCCLLAHRRRVTSISCIKTRPLMISI